MSKIYTVNNGESNSDQIPSIEYINELTKMVEDILISINPEFNGFSSIKSKKEELPVGVKENPIITASDVVTDASHKFISKVVLDTITDKPTKFEVDRSIEEAKKEIRDNVEKLYTRIVNTPNVINKLRDISVILNEDEVVDGLLDVLANKTNQDDFNYHVSSSTHMNNNDRKALNILIKCLMAGFADWNAKEGDYNAIKNKPESFPANGGNADTIANYGIRDLINKDDYDIIIGTDTEKYSADSCDIYAKDCEVDYIKFKELVDDIKNSGMIHFKRGYYSLNSIGIECDSYIAFDGADNKLTWLKISNIAKLNNVSFKNISFDKSTITIKSNCEFRNVRFSNCTINLDNSESCKIIECEFYNCTIIQEGAIMNNMIIYNRMIKTKPIVYIGGNNIIKDNL